MQTITQLKKDLKRFKNYKTGNSNGFSDLIDFLKEKLKSDCDGETNEEIIKNKQKEIDENIVILQNLQKDGDKKFNEKIKVINKEIRDLKSGKKVNSKNEIEIEEIEKTLDKLLGKARIKKYINNYFGHKYLGQIFSSPEKYECFYKIAEQIEKDLLNNFHEGDEGDIKTDMDKWYESPSYKGWLISSDDSLKGYEMKIKTIEDNNKEYSKTIKNKKRKENYQMK